jgi:uncharacterized protein (TIGR02996 family)
MAKVTMTGVVDSISTHRGWWGPYRHIELTSDTDRTQGCWFSDNGVGWIHFGNRGTVTGYTSERHEYNRLLRPKFEMDTTPLPSFFQSKEGLSLIKSAHAEPGNSLPRLVVADWLSDQGEPVNQALAEVIRSSLGSGGFKLLPWEIRAKAAPFTGAWQGWLIGRQPGSRDTAEKYWLGYRDHFDRYQKQKKKRR